MFLLLGAFVLMCVVQLVYSSYFGIKLSHKAKVKLGSPANMHISWWQPVLPMSSNLRYAKSHGDPTNHASILPSLKPTAKAPENGWN